MAYHYTDAPGSRDVTGTPIRTSAVIGYTKTTVACSYPEHRPSARGVGKPGFPIPLPPGGPCPHAGGWGNPVSPSPHPVGRSGRAQPSRRGVGKPGCPTPPPRRGMGKPGFPIPPPGGRVWVRVHIAPGSAGSLPAETRRGRDARASRRVGCPRCEHLRVWEGAATRLRAGAAPGDAVQPRSSQDDRNARRSAHTLEMV